jgi:hypothetical protein
MVLEEECNTLCLTLLHLLNMARRRRCFEWLVLKAAKHRWLTRPTEFRTKLDTNRKAVEADLRNYLDAVFQNVDWDNAYTEFKAARQSENNG